MHPYMNNEAKISAPAGPTLEESIERAFRRDLNIVIGVRSGDFAPGDFGGAAPISTLNDLNIFEYLLRGSSVKTKPTAQEISECRSPGDQLELDQRARLDYFDTAFPQASEPKKPPLWSRIWDQGLMSDYTAGKNEFDKGKRERDFNRDRLEKNGNTQVLADKKNMASAVDAVMAGDKNAFEGNPAFSKAYLDYIVGKGDRWKYSALFNSDSEREAGSDLLMLYRDLGREAVGSVLQWATPFRLKGKERVWAEEAVKRAVHHIAFLACNNSDPVQEAVRIWHAGKELRGFNSLYANALTGFLEHYAYNAGSYMAIQLAFSIFGGIGQYESRQDPQLSAIMKHYIAWMTGFEVSTAYARDVNEAVAIFKYAFDLGKRDPFLRSLIEDEMRKFALVLSFNDESVGYGKGEKAGRFINGVASIAMADQPDTPPYGPKN